MSTVLPKFTQMRNVLYIYIFDTSTGRSENAALQIRRPQMRFPLAFPRAIGYTDREEQTRRTRHGYHRTLSDLRFLPYDLGRGVAHLPLHRTAEAAGQAPRGRAERHRP